MVFANLTNITGLLSILSFDQVATNGLFSYFSIFGMWITWVSIFAMFQREHAYMAASWITFLFTLVMWSAMPTVYDINLLSITLIATFISSIFVFFGR